jgi:colicin import membrane protein
MTEITSTNSPEPPAGQVKYDASEALVLAGRAKAALAGATLEIDSDTMLGIAGEDLLAIKELQHQVEEKRLAITGPLNQALRMVNELFRAPKEYLLQAEQILKRAMVRYTQAQEEIAAAARREAEAMAHVERQRLMAEQERQGLIAQEAQEAAALELERAEQAAKQGDHAGAAAARAAAVTQAELARTARDEAHSAELTRELVTSAPPEGASSARRIAGISGRVTYSVEVTDLQALLQAVLQGRAPLQCVCPDEKFLTAQARAFKRAGPLYSGVRVVAQRSLAARRH